MNMQSRKDEPLSIPNLQDLHSALEAGSDGQKLLEVFKDAGLLIPINLTAITDLWLNEASEEENAA